MDNLKSIRFSGYKSFSDDTLHEIDFTSYVTTFIGKNNCGKSSVIDTIEYILDTKKYIENKSSIRQIDLSFVLNEKHIKSGFHEGTRGGEIYGDHFAYAKKYLGHQIYCKPELNTNFNVTKIINLRFSTIEPSGERLQINQWLAVAN